MLPPLFIFFIKAIITVFDVAALENVTRINYCTAQLPLIAFLKGFIWVKRA